jgi:sporulation protein YlmC with PRC-barrel domain
MTRGGDRVGLAHHVLDHQLIDSRGERCGKVDDLALALAPDGETMLVRGVLAGPGVLERRVSSRLLKWTVGLGGDRQVEVPWQHVSQILDHVSLALPAPDLGLAQGEQRAAQALERVLGPDAHAVKLGAERVDEAPVDETDMRRFSAVLGHAAVDEQGRQLGHVHELLAEKSGPLLSEAAGNAWVVRGACIGRSAWRARLGLGHHDARVRAVRSWPKTSDDPFVLGDEVA